MIKLTEKKIIVLAIILFAIILGVAIILKETSPKTDAETSKCIGENSVLYTRLGCHFCKVQEDIFGENYQYLNVIDCFFDESECINIEGTPTWIIKGEKYVGVQSFVKLKDLTGC